MESRKVNMLAGYLSTMVFLTGEHPEYYKENAEKIIQMLADIEALTEIIDGK